MSLMGMMGMMAAHDMYQERIAELELEVEDLRRTNARLADLAASLATSNDAMNLRLICAGGYDRATSADGEVVR